MPKAARVLGTCYVCGRRCWGRVLHSVGVDPIGGKGVVVRDVNGVRHGDCERRPWGSTGVTPADA